MPEMPERDTREEICLQAVATEDRTTASSESIVPAASCCTNEDTVMVKSDVMHCPGPQCKHMRIAYMAAQPCKQGVRQVVIQLPKEQGDTILEVR